MYKIKTYNKISKVGLDVFDDKYTVGDEVENADGAIVRSASLHDTEFPETLKAIARAGAGTNNIPIDRCSEKGIVVFNTPGANANAVKELVLAGLLIGSRRVISGIEWAKTLKGNGAGVGKMVEKGKGAFAGPEIKNKTLGVIGLGAIGVMVANAANALGMKVYGYDPYLSVKSAWNLTHNTVHIFDINEIFEKCDYITVHVPLTDSTKNLVNAEAIAIPHLGASTPESEENCAGMAARELIDYIENGNIVNSVNLPEITMPRSGENRICVIHKNIPNMLTAITGIFAEDNVNIENLLNKSKGEYAYTMLDIGKADVSAVADKIGAIDGVIRIRII